MTIRRSFALAGAVALASSIVLGGAQGALAVGSASSPSVAAHAKDKAAQQALGLSVQGVPNEFFAGDEAREFTFKINNTTGSDFVLIPLLKFADAKGKLTAADFTAEYQLPGSSTWAPVVLPPGASADDKGLVTLAKLDDRGELTDDSVQYLAKNKSLTIKVRVAFHENAPVGKAGVVPVVFSARIDEETGQPTGDGEFSCDTVKSSRFTIRAPKPAASPSPTKSGKPSESPSATVTASPSASESVTASPSATVSETATPTVTPSATASVSESASPSAPATEEPTATPSAPASSPAAPTSSAPAPATSAPASPGAPATSAAPASPSASATVGVPSPSASTEAPVDFPVTTPTATPPKITDTAVTKAKAAAEAADKNLAQTGGGSDSTPMAIAGGAVLAAGIGTLVVLRRRKGARHS